MRSHLHNATVRPIPLRFRRVSGASAAFPLILALFTSEFAHAAPPKLSRAAPSHVGMDVGRLQRIDEVVGEGLRRRRMPGCVVMIGRRGKVVWFKAYGQRRLQPSKERMTTDTIFDLASLTKPIATATCMMKLVELGRVDLDAPVAKYLPEFAANGKADITVKQLLTHQGGLIPDNALRDYNDGYRAAFRKIFALQPYVTPGSRFVYTDVGFLVLAELTRKLTGKNVHEYSQEIVFRPLGMRETGFLPRQELRARAATTQEREGRWMRGEVHDPRAYKLGGIAGHAGLFSTCEDLAVYAQMLLGDGQYGGVRILKRETIRLMSQPVKVSSGLRGLGWDMKTGFSSNRGDLATSRAYGHGGFTGTTFWVDPGHDMFVIFLSNRVHPDGKGSVNRLAGRIGTIAAASILLDSSGRSSSTSAPHKTPVSTGIDVLERDGYRQLRGRKVGLITNHTGTNRKGVNTAKLLYDSPAVKLVALFSPEHGFHGQLDVAKISDSKPTPKY